MGGIFPIWPVFLAIMFLPCGCATAPGRGGRIDSLHVFTVPVALDLDNSPGPDGFGVTLYASKAAVAKGIPVTNGKIEILMFDGALHDDAKTNAAPRRAWTFNNSDLKKHMIRTRLGTGYRLSPRWGETPPAQGRITIVARYLPPSGAIIRSAPTTIAVTSK